MEEPHHIEQGEGDAGRSIDAPLVRPRSARSSVRDRLTGFLDDVYVVTFPEPERWLWERGRIRIHEGKTQV